MKGGRCLPLVPPPNQAKVSQNCDPPTHPKDKFDVAYRQVHFIYICSHFVQENFSSEYALWHLAFIVLCSKSLIFDFKNSEYGHKHHPGNIANITLFSGQQSGRY